MGTFGRRLLTGLLSLVLLGLIMGAHSLILNDGDKVDPIRASGDIGSRVDAGRFTMKVDKVRFADRASDEGSTDSFKAKGVWVIVSAEVTPTRETLTDASATLDAGEMTYSGTTLLSNAIGAESGGGAFGAGAEYQPGIPVHGTFAFDVPRRHLQDLTIQARFGTGPEKRLSAEADVDLGLSGAELADKVDGAASSVAIPPIEMR